MVKDFFVKLKNVKNIEIIIAVVLCVVVLIIFFADFSPKEEETTDAFELYAAALENKLEKVLSKIEGVGKINVAITYDGQIKQVFAVNTQTQNNGTGTTTKTEIVLVDGKPLIEEELLPNIVGVLIVMEGANNAVTRMLVVEAITSLLNIDKDQIKILTYK